MHKKSLLERIKTQSFSYKEASLDDVLRQISNNLEILLNSKQGSTLISEDYGLPDFNGITHDLHQTLPFLEKEIKKVINKYEKRVHINRVKSIIDIKKNPGEIQFALEAYILYQQQKHYIEYQTIMTGTGKILVRRQ